MIFIFPCHSKNVQILQNQAARSEFLCSGPGNLVGKAHDHVDDFPARIGGFSPQPEQQNGGATAVAKNSSAVDNKPADQQIVPGTGSVSKSKSFPMPATPAPSLPSPQVKKNRGRV